MNLNLFPYIAALQKRVSRPPGGWLPLRTLLLAWLFLLVLTSTSCRKQESGAPLSQPLTNMVQNGLIHVLLKVDKAHPNVADQIRLTLEATVPEDYRVELPPLGPKLDQFTVREEQSSPPVLAGNNKTRQSRTYVLEPFLPGEYRIPSLMIEYWKKDDPPTNKLEIATQEISLVVRSLLDGESANIREITPPIDLPKSYGAMWLALAVGLVLLGLIAFLFWRRRQRAGLTAEPAIPPHKLALRALDQLLADDLVRKGEIKRFYQRITDILRHYIENRFGLAAPEQTTREFLVTLSANHTLLPNHKQLLHQFLRHCDLVKFAEHQPSPEDVTNTMESCRAFIIETGQAPAAAPALSRPD